MDEDDIERRAACGRHVEQALQSRAAVVRATRAGLDEFNGDIPAAGGAVGQHLPPLVGDRQDRDCRWFLTAKTIPTALCEARSRGASGRDDATAGRDDATAASSRPRARCFRRARRRHGRLCCLDRWWREIRARNVVVVKGASRTLSAIRLRAGGLSGKPNAMSS